MRRLWRVTVNVDAARFMAHSVCVCVYAVRLFTPARN